MVPGPLSEDSKQSKEGASREDGSRPTTDSLCTDKHKDEAHPSRGISRSTIVACVSTCLAAFALVMGILSRDSNIILFEHLTWLCWFAFWIFLIISIVMSIEILNRCRSGSTRLPQINRYIAICTIGASGMLLFLGFAKLPVILQLNRRRITRAVSCKMNLHALSNALQMYRAENDDRLPIASAWCDGISQFEEVLPFTCLQDSTRGDHIEPYSSYAFNSALSGLKYEDIEEPSRTIILFESEAGWNATGGPELLPSEARHLGRDIYGFADGHTEVISRKQRPGPEYWRPE